MSFDIIFEEISVISPNYINNYFLFEKNHINDISIFEYHNFYMRIFIV